MTPIHLPHPILHALVHIAPLILAGVPGVEEHAVAAVLLPLGELFLLVVFAGD